ncbi:type II secretion system F family protein [Candidatus Poribacteria bacterium]|nr:type II secretion system F family protein [Candidatus Poribacteria bacterium]
MPRFDYQAMTKAGTTVIGTLEAENSTELVAKLKSSGYFPMSVSESTSKAKGKVTLFNFKRKVKSSEVEFFSYQLATLINSGVPLIRSLSVASEQVNNQEFRDAIDQIRSDVEHGSTFYNALAQHKRIFTDLYVNIVRAGETGGVLGLVLTRLADFSEKQRKLKNAVISALFYPAILICVGLGIGSVLTLFVIPRLSKMFSELGTALPWPTQVLMAITGFIRGYWWVIAILIVGIFVFFRRYSRTETGKNNIDRLKLKLPMAGTIFRISALSRFARTLGTLLDNGVPILQSLSIVRETIGNLVYKNVIKNSEKEVERGESLAASLQRSGEFPALVTHMLAIGEESGKPQEMLMKLSEYYDAEIDKQLERVSSLIGPLIILFMALSVGFLVAAAVLPIFEASSMIGS